MIPPVLADITQCRPRTALLGVSRPCGRWKREGGVGERQAEGSGWALSPLPDSVFPHSQIIRVQSPEGVKRITATKRETVATFLKKVPRGPQRLPMGRGRAPVWKNTL